ncbi:MAG: HEAT repeat domain-containing protein [Planctomycetes bacterium]|nr:HEAT repeat domain-containing protein [Planctomycetota bacterium]
MRGIALTVAFATILAGVGTLPADEPPHRQNAPGAAEPWSDARVERELATVIAGAETDARRAFDALAAAPPERVVAPLARALRRSEPYPRVIAADLLGRLRHPGAIEPLVGAALADPVGKVRDLAVAGLARLQGPEAAWPFIDALGARDPARRIFAARALGAFGNPHAIPVVITRLSMVWGASNRGFVQIGQQVTYVRDYDIEIAANAAIANPSTGVVGTGIVEDVKVLKITRDVEIVERAALGQALGALTGADFGDNADAWAAWWKTNRAEVLGRYAAERAAERSTAEAGEVFAEAWRAEASGALATALHGYARVVREFPQTRFAAIAGTRLGTLEARPDLAERTAAESEEAACKGLLGRARSYLANGKRAEAAAALRTLLAKYPQSDFVNEAKRLLADCEAAPAGAGPGR